MTPDIDSNPTHARRGPTVSERLVAEEYELIQGVSVDGLVANVIIAVAVAINAADVSGTTHTLVWFAFVLCAVGVRYVLHRAYQRTPNVFIENPQIGRIVAASNFLLGLGWTWMAVLLLPMQDSLQLLTAFAATVAAAATAHTISPSRLALAAYLVPTLIPFTIALAVMNGGKYWLAALLMFVLLAMTWFTLNRFRTRILHSVEERFRRQESDTAMLRGAETANRLFAQVVTERERAEAELKIAKQVADDANQAKGEFLAYTSHEIRTPLNAIIGFANVVLESGLNATQSDYVRRMKNAGTRLLTLINDLLDLSKIEAGKLNIEYADFQLRQTLDEVVQEQAVKAKEKKIGIELHVADDVPDSVIGDSLRLRQIILNLVGNAIKFTSQGKVATSVSLKRIEDGVAHIAFSVTDTGIGIPQDKVGELFERYTQADASTARKYGGTGLGLSICKSLVELMGGEISVRSEAGKGSEFMFELPCKLQTPAAEQVTAVVQPPAAEQVSVAGMKVLVAEDNEHNQLLIELLLKKQGVEVTLAGDGAEAIEKWKTADYDLLFMDIEMPVMGGFEAVAEIRKQELGAGRRTPIVALSAHSPEEQRAPCIEAGMDDFLMKPLNVNALQAMLRKFSRPAMEPAQQSRAV